MHCLSHRPEPKHNSKHRHLHRSHGRWPKETDANTKYGFCWCVVDGGLLVRSFGNVFGLWSNRKKRNKCVSIVSVCVCVCARCPVWQRDDRNENTASVGTFGATCTDHEAPHACSGILFSCYFVFLFRFFSFVSIIIIIIVVIASDERLRFLLIRSHSLHWTVVNRLLCDFPLNAVCNRYTLAVGRQKTILSDILLRFSISYFSICFFILLYLFCYGLADRRQFHLPLFVEMNGSERNSQWNTRHAAARHRHAERALCIVVYFETENKYLSRTKVILHRQCNRPEVFKHSVQVALPLSPLKCSIDWKRLRHRYVTLKLVDSTINGSDQYDFDFRRSALCNFHSFCWQINVRKYLWIHWNRQDASVDTHRNGRNFFSTARM